MEHKIVADSCLDNHPRASGEWNAICRVPFRVTVDGEELVDEHTTVIDRLRRTCFRARTIRTACPSPADFIAAIGNAKTAFIVTISSALSGSYNAAMTACGLAREADGEREVHVFDSKTAAAGESLVTLRLTELVQQNLPVQQIVQEVEHYIKTLRTIFVLESLETLVSNGRVNPIQELACKALKLVPIMGDDGEGHIVHRATARGKKNAIARMIEIIGETGKDLHQRVLGITHVDAPETAREIRERVMALYPFKDVLIFEAGGLSSVYASNGGVVLAY